MPLTLIALFESQISHSRGQRLRLYFSGSPPEEDGDPKIEDPSCDEEGGEISRTKFEDLVKSFPEYVEKGQVDDGLRLTTWQYCNDRERGDLT